MSQTRQIGVNVITQWISFILRAAIGILLVPFLIRELGRDVYGLAILLGIVVSFAEIADMGLRMALGRNLAEALAENDKKVFNRLASTASAIWLVIGSGMAALCVVCAPAIVDFLEISEAIRSDAIFLVMTFGGGSVLLAFIQPVFTAVLSSSNRFDIVNKLDACYGLLSGILLFVILSVTEYGIYGWAGVMFGGKLLIFAVQLVAAKRLVPSLRLSPALVNGESFHKLFSISGYLFFLQLTNMLSMKADPIILSRFLGPASLALYNPGLMLSSRVRPLVMVLADQLYPVTTKFHTTGDNNQMEAALFVGTRITLCMGIGVFAILGVFSQDICRIWLESTLGPDYRIAGYILLGWALVDLFQAAAGTQWAVLIGKAKIKFAVWVNFPLAIVNVGASIYLVGFTSVGIVGVIVPTVLIGAFRRFFIFWYVSRICGVGCLRYFKEAYIRPILILTLVAPIGLLLTHAITPTSFIVLLLMLGITAVVWILSFLFIGIRPAERSFIFKKVFRRKLSKRGSFL